MTSPADEFPEPHYPIIHQERSSDEEGTVVDKNGSSGGTHLNINTAHNHEDIFRSQKSPSQSRADASKLEDDLRMLQVERQISREYDKDKDDELRRTNSDSVKRERSRREEVVDEFDVATNPLHERTQLYKPPAHPSTRISKFIKRVHHSSFLIRYVTYITPVVLILLIPLLIGALVPGVNGGNGPGGGEGGATVGGVSLFWFMVWLEIVWLTLWLGRIIAKLLPYPAGLVASLFTNNSKKWRDMVKQLELAATLFFWWLAIEISFLPTMIHHQRKWDPHKPATAVQSWQSTMNKILISFLVLASLNLVEKIIIQLIAISFHLRTYADRIELNKFQIGSLTKLYSHSKVKLQVDDSDFEAVTPAAPGSGTRTPGGIILEKAQKSTQKAVNQLGDVAGKIAGDFTGRAVTKSNHPSQVTLALLSTTSGSQVLARRLYRTFSREETETVHQEDLTEAFDNQEECDAAFAMFDKDMNGDISMEELEAVCVEIGRERKAITASLKDLDSVVSKLDDCFMFFVVIIAILVLISLLSSAAATGLSSAGSVVLGLSWLFSATATEFLQSTIFVFVKHPYDVGDRVTIYGNTGATLTGDDYFVKEISLLYTEFKKMEGHQVQAPNNYLNTLFILNQRRSGGLAEAVPVTVKFGTSLDQIDGLRQKLLEFVEAEKREYQGKILTELRDVYEAHSITLNIVFFFKSNWQNELLRLQRRNKFICALMVAMQDLGIEGPRMRYPGQKDSFPVYLQNVPFSQNANGNLPNNNSGGLQPPREEETFAPSREEQTFVPLSQDQASDRRYSSNSRTTTRPRGESIAQMSRRLDFSLGMSSVSASDSTGDVFDDRDARRPRIPPSYSQPRPSRDKASSRATSHDIAHTTSRSATFGPEFFPRASADVGRNSGSVHRNRFFTRRSHDSDNRMESGMAGIPEAETPGADAAMDHQRLDPRTGLISPAAVRGITGQSMSGQPLTDDNRPLFQNVSAPGPEPAHTTDNHDFEMRNMTR